MLGDRIKSTDGARVDFLKDVQWGNVFTAITLITTLVLAFRDASRTRAENAAKNAEANKTESDAADRITDSALKLLTPKDNQIEQQDLQIARLLSENLQLSNKFNALETEFRAKSEEHTKAISELTRQALEWKEERKEWERGIGVLLSQLVRAKIVPLWLPKGITISEIEIEPRVIVSGLGGE